MLRLAARFHSTEEGHAGYIPDRLLEELEENNPASVQELVSSGAWERIGNAYEDTDRVENQRLQAEYAARHKAVVDAHVEREIRAVDERMGLLPPTDDR